MKKFIVLGLILLTSIFLLIHGAYTKTKSYYSGDAISFNNKVYVATTNTKKLEIFRLENNKLDRIVNSQADNDRFGRPGNFYDVKFSIENGHLFVYAVSGFSFYKYELINNLLIFVAKRKNTYWEWYNRIDKFGNQIVTISSKGIKFWNNNLQVVKASNISNVIPYNLRFGNGHFLLNVAGNKLQVYNLRDNEKVSDIPVNYKGKPGNHQSYQDTQDNLYIVDDYYTKKFNLDGKLLASFRHLDRPGYDVAASNYNNYIYFSNGVGVVKLNKNDMSLVSYRYTGGLAGPRGWAMGLKVVNAHGDKVVVFNNSSILVLDDNLNKLASFQATEKADESSTEHLFLRLDHIVGGAGATINLNGGGYFPNEKLDINFGSVKMSSMADSRGRFNQVLTVPDLDPGRLDIKVVGESSKLSYSIAFEIQ